MKSSNEIELYQPHVGRTLFRLAMLVSLLWLLAFFFD